MEANDLNSDTQIDTGFGAIEQPEPQDQPEQLISDEGRKAIEDAAEADAAAAEQAAAEKAALPSKEELKAMAEREERGQPARGFEVDQAAQAAQAGRVTALAQDHGTFIDLGDGNKIVRTAEGGVKLQLAEPKPDVDTQQKLSPRAMTRRDMELQAGRDAVARHEEMERNRPKPVKTKAEIDSEGRSTPVFRPDAFREYLPITAPAANKENVGALQVGASGSPTETK